MEFQVAIQDNKEIEFIHDISNQIVIAQGGVGFVFSRLKKKNKLNQEEHESIEKIIKAIEIMINRIKEEKHQLRLK